MERIQREVVVISIPKASKRSAPGLFGRNFTVTATQAYEISYTLSNPTEMCSIFKRYRQFRDLRRTLSDEPLPAFPEKRYFGDRKTCVVEERRVQLQTWLQALLGNKDYQKQLAEFLEISQQADTRLITEEEQIVLDFVSKVETNSRMKLSWLASLDTALFAHTPRVRLEYVRKLVDLLTLLCADHVAGCKAICILHKLTSREFYRDHATVVQVWLSLGPDRLRAMGLDLHLLHQMYADTREEAFHMYKIVHDAWLSMGRAFLLKVLNDNLEAYSLFERWVGNRLDASATVATETTWRLLANLEGHPDLRIYFRFIENYVELKVGMRVQTTCERLVGCLLDPEERAKWDLTFKPEVAQGKPQEGVMRFHCEINGILVEVKADFKMARQWPNRTCIDFTSREDPATPVALSYLSRYILIPGSHHLPGTPKTGERPHFPAFPEPSPCFPNEQKAEMSDPVILLKFYALMSKCIAKVYLPDLVGESDKLRKRFLGLKRFAEEDSQSPVRQNTDTFLYGAVERKTLTPTHKGRLTKRINLLTMAVDDASIHKPRRTLE